MIARMQLAELLVQVLALGALCTAFGAVLAGVYGQPAVVIGAVVVFAVLIAVWRRLVGAADRANDAGLEVIEP